MTAEKGKLTLKGLGYGFLNDVSDTSAAGGVDRQRSNGLDFLNSAISSQYSRSALEKVTAFKGVVIGSAEKFAGASRSTEDLLAGYAKQGIAADVADWISSFFGQTMVTAYKVYIPEIECRPAPRSFEDPIITTYYDVYVDKGMLDRTEAIAVGSIVTVRFDNINNFSTARIIGVSKETFEFEGFEGGSLEAAAKAGKSALGGSGGGTQFHKAYGQKARSKCKQEPHPEEVRIAKYFGLEVAILQAVGTVESGGRNDSIRFEPHMFLRDFRPDLKGKIPFTKDPVQPFSRVRKETNEAAFQYAYTLDKTAAVKSVSWGRFQVLGGKLIKIFGSAEKGVNEYKADPEATSFKLLEMWLKTDNGPKALAAAKEKDFVTFARYYNGPSQKFKYGGAIAREYNAITCGEYVPPVFGTDPALASGCGGEGAVIYLADSQHAADYSFGGLLRKELKSQGVPLVKDMSLTGRGLVAGGGKGFLKVKLKKELKSQLSSIKPKYAIVGLGGNDAGMVGVPPGWTAESWKKKAEKFIQILKDGGVEEIIWIGVTKPMLPDTPHLKNNGWGGLGGNVQKQKKRDTMRNVQKEVLASFPEVTYIDSMQYTQNLHTYDGVHYKPSEYKTWFDAAMAGDLKAPLAAMIKKIKDGCAEYEKNTATAAPFSVDSKCYDDTQDIPNKSQHASILADVHPDFLPHVKSFICEAWKQKKITIRLNSSYRSVEKQQRLYNKWVNGGKRGIAPANPATGLSYHNLGMAIDFNPTLANGTTLMSTSSKSSWRNSGIVEIGKAADMYWGGNFSTNFDPIHFDFRNRVARAKRPRVLTAANSQGVPPNKANLDGIIT